MAIHEAAAKFEEERLRRKHPELFGPVEKENIEEIDPTLAAPPDEDPKAAAAEARRIAEEEAALAAKEEEQRITALAEEEEKKFKEVADSVQSAVETGFDLLLLGWILFNPKALFAYFIMGGAAYRAAFRYLSSQEASELHRAEAVVRTT